jgi:hypothetical protein
MDVIKLLEACDKVVIPLFIANIADSRGVIEPGRQCAGHLCLNKPKGQLALELDVASLATAFGYTIGTELIVTFAGTRLGIDSMGKELVAWQAVTPVTAQFDDTMVTLSSGRFTTTVRLLDQPEQRPTCDGQRTYVLELASQPIAADTIVIDASQSILGQVEHDTITISEIAMSARAGLVASAAVRIVPHGPSICPPNLIAAGEQLELRAVASGVPAGVDPEFAWVVTGAAVAGSLADRKVALTLPAAGVAVSVNVYMSAANIPAADHIEIHPMAASDAKQVEGVLRLLCRIRAEVVRNRFFDPLDDPLRRSGRLSRQDIASLVGSADRVANLAREMTDIARGIHISGTHGDPGQEEQGT